MYSLLVIYAEKARVGTCYQHGFATTSVARHCALDLLKDPMVSKVVLGKMGYVVGFDGEREKHFDEICTFTIDNLTEGR
jgi:acyl dehydratase